MSEEWKDQINGAFKKSPRFALLDQPKILRALGTIGRGDIRSLAFLLRLCFPDLQKEMSEDSVSFSEIVASAAPEHAKRGSGDMPPGVLLSVVLEILSKVTEQLEQRQALVPSTASDRHGSTPRVLDAAGVSDEILMRDLECSMCCLPLASQLLWAQKDVSPQDLDRFLVAVKRLPFIQFAIIGVDKLNVDSRETLLRSLAAPEATSDETQATVGDQLLLVFTGRDGIDAFSSFPLADKIMPFDVSQRAAAKSLPSLFIVSGDAGAGKTTYIRQQFKSLSVKMQACLTVHEDFTPADFIQQYADCIAAETPPASIGIHISITPYGNLHRLGRFLYGLFSHGLLVDEASGAVVAMAPGVQHSLYLELPVLADPASVPATAAEASRHPYMDSLPAVRLLARDLEKWVVVTTATFPFLIDDESRITCHYLKLYREGKLEERAFNQLDGNDFLTHLPAEKLPDEECIGLLDKLFNDPHMTAVKSHSQRSACIRLLAERVRFLPNLYRKVLHDFQSKDFYCDNINRPFLMEDKNKTRYRYMAVLLLLFMKESAALSDGASLKQDWSRLPTPLTARYDGIGSDDRHYFHFNILCVSASDEEEAKRQSEGSSVAISGASIRTYPSSIRSNFAPGFGIGETSDVVKVMKSQSYVLTLDFAVKMQVLFELRKIKSPVILQGETGMFLSSIPHSLS